MGKAYDVYLDENVIGRVCMTQQGLYWFVSCRCHLPNSDLYTLQVSSNSDIVDLGLLYPIGNEFGMDTRIPAKKLGQGSWCFFAKSKNTSNHQFLLEEGKPITCLQSLQDCRFVRRDGKPYLVLHAKK